MCVLKNFFREIKLTAVFLLKFAVRFFFHHFVEPGTLELNLKLGFLELLLSNPNNRRSTRW